MPMVTAKNSKRNYWDSSAVNVKNIIFPLLTIGEDPMVLLSDFWRLLLTGGLIWVVSLSWFEFGLFGNQEKQERSLFGFSVKCCVLRPDGLRVWG